MRKIVRSQRSGDPGVYGRADKPTVYDSCERYPRSVIRIGSERQTDKLHPTQKPVALIENGVTTLTAKIGTVSGTVADALAGKAAASVVSSLAANVADQYSSISSLQSVTAGLEDGLEAKVGLVLNVNGKISGFSSVNDGTTSTFDIVADNFRLASGSTAVVPFAVIGSTVYAQNLVMQATVSGQGTTTVNPNGVKVVDSSGVTRVKLGLLSLL